MTGEWTASYITHHLQLAGRSGPLFSDDATALIHATSRGLPRAVNNLAIQALIAAYAAPQDGRTPGRPDPRELRPRQVRAAGSDQGRVRPGQRVPPERQHPASFDLARAATVIKVAGPARASLPPAMA
jgi:hypothetical protein